eukprot:scaffold37620_cov168-Skeletonema_marinoi.AAC.1
MAFNAIEDPGHARSERADVFSQLHRTNQPSTHINSLPIIGCEGPDHAIARHTANLQFLIDQSERLSIVDNLSARFRRRRSYN